MEHFESKFPARSSVRSDIPYNDELDDYNQTSQTFTILGEDNLDPFTIIIFSKTIDLQEMIEGLDIEQLLIMMVEHHRKII